ncbi:MAG: hypothetical protein PUJ52_05220 [Firmicutes bacterium]|nr:hypothetical protein [Bacillota bacterium]
MPSGIVNNSVIEWPSMQSFLTIAQEKEMILIVAAASQKAAIMQSILKKAGPDSKAGTILFSLPTTQVAGFALLDSQDET